MSGAFELTAKSGERYSDIQRLAAEFYSATNGDWIACVARATEEVDKKSSATPKDG